MKFNFFKIFSFAVTLCLLSVSCKKPLDIEPRQSIDAETALTTRDNVNAAITGVYSRLKSARQYGRDLIALPEALADNGFATNKSGRLNPEANNNSGAHFTAALWQNSYAGINEVNGILAQINSIPDGTAADKLRWEGELSFLRALFHFNVAEAYAYMPGSTVTTQDKGGIPILLTATTGTIEALLVLPARAPIADVYNQIVTDLETANARLTFGGSTDVNLANKAAAQAMLSRVNLYRKDYVATKKWADSAIALAGNRLASASGYVNQWRVATHQETLFQVRFGLNSENIGVNESLQTSFTTLAELGNRGRTSGFGDLVPTLTLLTDLGITLTGGNTSTANYAVNHSIASRSTDVRNLLYEVGTTGRGPAKVETTKFFGKNGAINLDNIPVIRVSELYLNRAEAMATIGSPVYNEVAALTDLNTIATNRGVAPFVLVGTPLATEVFRQRRIELAFEGHRFFDLKRLGRDILKGPHYLDVAFTDFRILAPLPQREIDGNRKLVQNFGY